jgi:hypothetical protein
MAAGSRRTIFMTAGWITFTGMPSWTREARKPLKVLADSFESIFATGAIRERFRGVSVNARHGAPASGARHGAGLAVERRR